MSVQSFFGYIQDIFTILNNFTIIGNLSLLHILLVGLVITVIGHFIKGKSESK